MRRVPAVVAAAGWVLVALGATVFWQANRPGDPVDFGWASYTPLQPGEPLPVVSLGDGTVLWTRGHLAGAALVVLGLLVLAALAGWWFGRRQGRPPTL